MNDQITLLGLPLLGLSTRVFAVALGLAVLAYERGEARARAEGDARWLLVSLGLAAVAAFGIELDPADGFLGAAELAIEGVLGAALVGLGELALLVAAGARARLGQSGGRAAPVLRSAR